MPPGACWRAWPAGVFWQLGARGPGTCNAQAPGSCASPIVRAASRRPSGLRARASAARVAPPCDVTRNCVPARPLRKSARHRVSPAFNLTPSRHGPQAPFTTWLPASGNWGPENRSPVPLRVFSPLPGSSYHLQGKPCLDTPAPFPLPSPLVSPSWNPTPISHLVSPVPPLIHTHTPFPMLGPQSFSNSGAFLLLFRNLGISSHSPPPCPTNPRSLRLHSRPHCVLKLGIPTYLDTPVSEPLELPGLPYPPRPALIQGPPSSPERPGSLLNPQSSFFLLFSPGSDLGAPTPFSFQEHRLWNSLVWVLNPLSTASLLGESPRL